MRLIVFSRPTEDNPPLDHVVMVEDGNPAVNNEVSSSATSPAVTEASAAAMGFYIATGCACGLIAALVALTSILYVRNRKRRQQNSIIE
jgi:hypothetical protein